MTVTIEKTQTEEIELQVPCFFRDKAEKNYVGVLDEKTVVVVYKSENFTIIKNSTPDVLSLDLKEAYSKFHSCTETEFMEKYDQVVESISLHPKLAV